MTDKKRAKNLTKDDVELLTGLVFRFRNVIENKKTDGVTVKQKNDAWTKIAEEFSASASHPRNAEQLRNYYKNTKSNLKKELAQEKADQFRTGGGSASGKRSNNNPLLEIVQREVTPLSNPYDSTSQYFNDVSQPSTSRANVGNRYHDCFQEFIALGGDPEELGIGSDEQNTSGLSATPGDLADPVILGAPASTPATPNASAAETATPAAAAAAQTATPAAAAALPTTPDASEVIRNNKRQRVNFNTLREYVGELGELKKRKCLLQNKLLELQIKKLEQELDLPGE